MHVPSPDFAPRVSCDSKMITLSLTAVAMLAFAANSVLCRMALADGDCDAATFTVVRVASGAVMLVLVNLLRRRGSGWKSGRWDSATCLALYAGGFSFAYLQLDAGTGALILFALVQATMIIAAVIGGERPRWIAWLGIVVAAAGTTYLFLPGLSAPSPIGAGLMAMAGLGWGFYSLRGRGVTDPIGATGGNFIRATLLLIPLILLWWPEGLPSIRGGAAALASGMLMSGLGYVIWYLVLPRLATTRAAVVQLTVPVIAALGGVVILNESVTLRLALASGAILGGVGLVFVGRAVGRAN